MLNDVKLPLILTSSPTLEDSYFEQTVILLAEYNEEGALGFVINRKSRYFLHEIVDQKDFHIPAGIPAWEAGPVPSATGFVLHNQVQHSDEEQFVPGAILSTTRETLQQMVRFYPKMGSMGRAAMFPYKLLVGYAGWGAGQLDTELKCGTWLTSKFCPKLVFSTPHDQMWLTSIQSLGMSPGANLATQQSAKFLH